MTPAHITLSLANDSTDLELVRNIFQEYARTLSVDLCFQDFETELRQLPGEYAEPRGALVLARGGRGARLTLALADGEPDPAHGPLAARGVGNAMAPMLPLFDALAAGHAGCRLKAGPGRILQVDIAHD